MNKLLVAMALTVCALTGANFATAAGASTDVSMDAVAPWVEVTRYIPVYVNGQLTGYIVVKEWVWVPEAKIEQ